MGSEARGKVLLPIDDSHQAGEAVGYAAGMLDPGKFQVTIFHISYDVGRVFYELHSHAWLVPQSLVDSDQLERERFDQVEKLMQGARGVLLEAGFPPEAVETKVEIQKRSPALDIIHEIKHGGYALVILGRTGQSKIKDLVLGSTAETILARSPRHPMWIVGGSAENRRILFAIDNTDWAGLCVDHLIRLYHNRDMEITLLHTVRSAEAGGAYLRDFVTPNIQREINEESMRVMRPVLDRARRQLIDAGFKEDKVTEKFVTGVDSRAEAIVDEARAGNYGTILLGRGDDPHAEFPYIGRVAIKVLGLAKGKVVAVVC